MKRSIPDQRGVLAMVVWLVPMMVAQAGDSPRVLSLRTQEVGALSYFHVSVAKPPDLRLPEFSVNQIGTEAFKRALARLPCLVPQDRKASHVYPLPVLPEAAPRFPQLPGETLVFVGRVQGTGKGRFRLLYPLAKKAARAADPNVKAGVAPAPAWETVDLTLDFSAAVRVPIPQPMGDQARSGPPGANDLERLWATGQALRFAVLEVQSPDFGFFPFAREATGRKYRVAAPALAPRPGATSDSIRRKLYEMTTGAVAISELLQLERLLSPTSRDRGQRTIPIERMRGVGLGTHPWEKLMAGKKPAPEPLARLTPHDQYFIHFKDAARLLDLIDLFEQWGTELTNSVEINSREYDLRNRYDRQLCVSSRGPIRVVAPLVIHEVVVTGSDLYFLDGTDLTFIFRVVNRTLFLSALDPYLNAARKEFGSRLQETKTVYRGIAIDSHVTPLREISLHRAFLKDDIVIYSNSLVALRRTLDTHLGRYRALADTEDFRFLRTVFPFTDREEDGFVFFSDALIRRLVGPAAKIAQKRRREALTSLHMVTRAALFAAWENGRLPVDTKELLAAAKLPPEAIYIPEGKTLTWDPAGRQAVSDVYNTLRFATPLAELPVDKITPSEEREYNQFREAYRSFWDDIGPLATRFTVGPTEIRAETLIPPLVKNSWYDALRVWTGDGTVELRPSAISPQTLIEYHTHLNAALFDVPPAKGNGQGRRKSSLGNWFSIALDDSPLFADFVSLHIRRELEPRPQDDVLQDAGRLIFRAPLIVGVGIRDRKAFQKQLDDYEDIFQWLLGEFRVEKNKLSYKGVPITVVRFAADSQLAQLVPVKRSARPTFEPVLYHAFVGDGWYLTLNESCLKDRIDRSVARLRPTELKKAVPVNSSLYLAPGAAVKAGAAVRSYLEWETHRRTLANGPEWYTLFRCRLIDPKMSEKQRLQAALHYLGYLPISADSARYEYDPQADEVSNVRHGSFRRPILHADPAPTSSVAELLDQFRTFRADFRFQNGGMHTIVTLERKVKAK
jgi:hypothetical protein